VPLLVRWCANALSISRVHAKQHSPVQMPAKQYCNVAVVNDSCGGRISAPKAQVLCCQMETTTVQIMAEGAQFMDG
jgi:hypothetical protein